MMYSSKWRHWRELAVGGKCNLGSGGSWRRGVEGSRGLTSHVSMIRCGHHLLSHLDEGYDQTLERSVDLEGAMEVQASAPRPA